MANNDLRLYSKEELEFRVYLLERNISNKEKDIEKHKRTLEDMIQDVCVDRNEMVKIRKWLKKME